MKPLKEILHLVVFLPLYKGRQLWWHLVCFLIPRVSLKNKSNLGGKNLFLLNQILSVKVAPNKMVGQTLGQDSLCMVAISLNTFNYFLWFLKRENNSHFKYFENVSVRLTEVEFILHFHSFSIMKQDSQPQILYLLNVFGLIIALKSSKFLHIVFVHVVLNLWCLLTLWKI